MCDRYLALLGDGALRDLPGGVDEYLVLREAMLTGTSESAAGEDVPAPVVDAAAGRAARKEMARVERLLGKLADSEAKLHAEMAAKATDHEAVAALDAQLRALHAQREQAESEWMAAAEIAG
jgi:hypothetical protein